MLLAGGSLGHFPSAVLGEEGFLKRGVTAAEANIWTAVNNLPEAAAV